MTTYHLYSDGNYFPRAKKSGFGGYIEDSDSQVLVEYTEQIRIANYAYSYELLGIIRGLQIAKSMGIENIHSHCDDKNTIEKLQEVFAANSVSCIPHYNKPELYQEIMDLSKQFTNFEFSYIPRHLNKHSDALSRRYSTMMEKNFLRQFTDELDRSENVLENNSETNKKIFFSHPSLIRVSFKNNPFQVAHVRNRKVRRVSKVQEADTYDYLFIEAVTTTENVVLSGYYYDKEEQVKILLQQNIVEHGTPDVKIANFCNITAQCTEILKEKGSTKLWIYSNSDKMNQYFEQKEKIPNTSIESFSNVFKAFEGLDKIYFHRLPFEHEFNPEIALIEKQKKNIGESLDSVEILMEQLQNGVLEREQKKSFGMLIKHHLRNYKTLLERDLNDLEKHQIIQQTTEDLIAKGVINLPEFKKMKM